MTKNSFKDGEPTGLWARAARSPKGVFGVAVGLGDVQFSFIPEEHIAAFLDATVLHVEASGHGELLGMVYDASKGLPNFKRTVAAVKSAAVN